MNSESDKDIGIEGGWTNKDCGAAWAKLFSSRTAESQAGWFLPYLQPSMTLLDCGCGTGSITLGLAKAVEPGMVTGIDFSEHQIARAEKLASKEKIPNLHFETGDICQLKFPDDSFDALFSHNAIEHIPDYGKALQEIHRVLKPGGVVGIRDVDYGGNIFAPDDTLMERRNTIIEARVIDAGAHTRLGRHLGRILHEAGFVDVKASASYDVYSDSESCYLLADATIATFGRADFRDHVIKSGVTSERELEKIARFMQAWQELPGAFYGISHCDAIGRKG